MYIFSCSNVFRHHREQESKSKHERRYEDMVFSFPGELVHIEIKGRYAKCFHLKKAGVSGCHADKPDGADYYYNTNAMEVKLMQEISTRQSTRGPTPICSFPCFVIFGTMLSYRNYFIRC